MNYMFDNIIITVKCNVTQWSDWSECSESCGVGRKTRTRRVRGPELPDCPDLTDWAECYEKPCREFLFCNLLTCIFVNSMTLCKWILTYRKWSVFKQTNKHLWHNLWWKINMSCVDAILVYSICIWDTLPNRAVMKTYI